MGKVIKEIEEKDEKLSIERERLLKEIEDFNKMATELKYEALCSSFCEKINIFNLKSQPIEIV